MRSTSGSVFNRPSESSARFSRLRERLRRSGAMVSSRSVLSRLYAASEDLLVVDVGDGKTPTAVEQLIARLEQHGLRRCLLKESDIAECTVAPWVNVALDGGTPAARDGEDEVSGADHDDGNTRESYYYMCVPCETRLTNVSVAPATKTMLDDMHYHFSSAAHREAASWMADPDIDETLTATPLIEDPHAYTRIHVNGVPMLLSRRPGGGDLFYALPHEADRVSARKVVRRASVMDKAEDTDPRKPGEGLLFPSPRYSSDANYWYHPLTSVDTQCKQLVTLQRKDLLDGAKNYLTGNVIRQSTARRAIRVTHVPVEEYLQHTLLDKDRVTVRPCLFALQTHKLPKNLGNPKRQRDADAPQQESSGGKRPCYIQPKVPYVSHLTPHPGPAEKGGEEDTTAWCNRCLVEPNSVFRVALVSGKDEDRMRCAQDGVADEDADHTTQPTLTREVLSKLTSYMPFQRFRSVGTSISSRGHSSSWMDNLSTDSDGKDGDRGSDATGQEVSQHKQP